MEVMISVDVETSGPVPGEYSLLQIGACVSAAPDLAFECNLKPISQNFDPDALKVTGLNLEELSQSGMNPEQAMGAFDAWIASVSKAGDQPVFVGFNASFDWSFINYYFVRFLGRNPFGISAIDIKSMYFGSTNCRWGDTHSTRVAQALDLPGSGDHSALNDARFQAGLFESLRCNRAVRR